jgi:hypothetical protein
MALLRAVGVPCRLHAFTIDRGIQRGAIPVWLLPVVPRELLHTWVEVRLGDRWTTLEGFILDQPYLAAVQRRFAGCTGPFRGYAVATPNLADPGVAWSGGDTYIQRDGILRDLGTYDTPDDFYREHHTNARGPKRLLYGLVVRHLMNRNVRRIRRGLTPATRGEEPPEGRPLAREHC